LLPVPFYTDLTLARRHHARGRLRPEVHRLAEAEGRGQQEAAVAQQTQQVGALAARAAREAEAGGGLGEQAHGQPRADDRQLHAAASRGR